VFYSVFRLFFAARYTAMPALQAWSLLLQRLVLRWEHRTASQQRGQKHRVRSVAVSLEDFAPIEKWAPPAGTIHHVFTKTVLQMSLPAIAANTAQRTIWGAGTAC